MVSPRENRVPIMMSDEELTLIDDWRYANRVATRSDAVRRLCRVGLVSLERFNAFVEIVNRTVDDYEQTEINIESYLERLPKTMDRDQALEIALLYSTLIAKGGVDDIWKIYDAAWDLYTDTTAELVDRREIKLPSKNPIHAKAVAFFSRLLKQKGDPEDQL